MCVGVSVCMAMCMSVPKSLLHPMFPALLFTVNLKLHLPDRPLDVFSACIQTGKTFFVLVGQWRTLGKPIAGYLVT